MENTVQKIRSIESGFIVNLLSKQLILQMIMISVIIGALVSSFDQLPMVSNRLFEMPAANHGLDSSGMDNKPIIISKNSSISVSAPPGKYLFHPIIIPDRLGFPLDKNSRAYHSFLEPAVLPATSLSSQAQKQIDTNRGNSTITVMMKKKDRLFHSIIVKAADRHEIDPALVKAIIMAESGYNPKAISKRGAKGLMQLMPNTAKSLGVEKIFDPEHNINGGVLYFKRLVNRFNGDIKLSLAAYNAGAQKVKKYRGVPPFKATRFYIKKVFMYYEYFKDQMAGNMNRA